MVQILAVNALLLAVLFLVLWRVSIRINDVSFVDSFWAFGMAMLAVATWFQASGSPERMNIIAVLALLWGLRLGSHLYIRWRAMGVDPRYKWLVGRSMEKKGWSFARVSGVEVFGFQALLLFVACLPAQLGQISDMPYNTGWIAFAGKCLALFGIGFETIADMQLARFREDPANKGKVLDTGLWRYTRHPNYFGDACTWWGIWLIAAETSLGLFSIIGPILITWLLTRKSGVPLLEYSLKKNKPGYEDYVRRTSSFFPWPPRS